MRVSGWRKNLKIVPVSPPVATGGLLRLYHDKDDDDLDAAAREGFPQKTLVYFCTHLYAFGLREGIDMCMLNLGYGEIPACHMCDG